jgi:nucleoside-diphosphate-sugar epimerase
MNVFLTGATGYIGSVVAERLIERGHKVIGLARSEAARQTLEARGITPHMGDLNDTTSLQAAAKAADGVIHAAQERFQPGMDMNAMAGMAQTAARAVAAMLEALDGSGKPIIITGGTGAYPNSDAVMDETTPIPSHPMTDLMQHTENSVLNARGIRGIALRPGIVYGRGSGPVSMFVGMTQQARQAFVVDGGENYVSTVHVDDLADLYVLALEKAQAGTLFNAVAEPFVQMKAIMGVISQSVGLGGALTSLPMDQAFNMLGMGARIMSYNMKVSAQRARDLLGWTPHRPTVLEELASGSYIGSPREATIR